MAEFIPNLDDGEMWIPSDILLADVPPPAASKTPFPPPPLPSSPSPPPLFCQSSRHLSIDVDLARRFDTLALLNRARFSHTTPMPTHLSSSQLQRFVPAHQYALTASPWPPTPTGPPPVHHTPLFGFRPGSSYSTPGPVLNYHILQPLQPRADGLTETRVTGYVQRRQNRFTVQNGIFPPVQGGGCGGGFVRDCGGTGVFLPRAAAGDGGRRKQGEFVQKMLSF